MAAHERLLTGTSIASSLLLERLATVLPKDVGFKIHHLSSPPTRTSAIYSAPPGTRPDRTYCESHFLTASIHSSSSENAEDVLVFAIEILIYSTAYDTTFFVSKADSTGFLHILNLPKGIPSPLKDISATFLRYLVEHHSRPNIKSVISLFARAQDQYLFPGSVEYQGKHVLDDRGLVRWWCRVLDPIIKATDTGSKSTDQKWDSVKGYLIVPGLDVHETSAYVPKIPPSEDKVWTVGHPLHEISHHSNDVPPRCLIPHFPDDPKARFLDELDEEITKGADSPSGQWKSVRTIDQFWEMMAYRQECSAGRMVGFIWIVFTPKYEHPAAASQIDDALADSQSTVLSAGRGDGSSSPSVNPSSSFGPLISPLTSFTASSQIHPTSSSARNYRLPESPPATSSDLASKRQVILKKKKKKKLTGAISSRQPKIKTQTKNYLLDIPMTTAYYHWPTAGRGQIIVDESDYKRNTELLLRLDFANLELAASSSRRWTNEVCSGVSGDMRNAWGQIVVGKRSVEQQNATNVAGEDRINIIPIKKKRKGGAENREDTLPPAVAQVAPPINVLGAGMVRKKAKV
jgi:regulator of Ty1 transposition protein 109